MASKYSFETREQKLQALRDRDPRAEGWFVYAVKSTRKVCRPTCSARLAILSNIVIYPTAEKAIKDGFDPCKRCKPLENKGWNHQRELVAKACKILDESALCGKFHLQTLSQSVGCTKWHLLRAFKRYTGKTPKQYFDLRAKGDQSIVVLPEIETKKHYATNDNRPSLGQYNEMETGLIESIRQWEPSNEEMSQMEAMIRVDDGYCSC